MKPSTVIGLVLMVPAMLGYLYYGARALISTFSQKLCSILFIVTLMYLVLNLQYTGLTLLQALWMKSEMLTWKRLLLFSLAVALATVGIVKLFSERASTIVKEGKVKDIEYDIWHNHSTLSRMAEIEYGVTKYSLSRPSTTILHFEDGETIVFVGVIDNVEVGGKYRIVYHERYVPVSGNPYWSGNYYEIDNIEEIEL